MATIKKFSCSIWQLAGLLLVGIIAGFFSYLVSEPFPFFYYFTPGLIFALAITIFLPKLLGINIKKKHIAFILFSTVSYFIAFLVYIAAVWSTQFGDNQLSILFISGFIGSLFFLAGYGFFVSSFPFRSFLLLIFLGSFLSLFFYPALSSNSGQVNNMADVSFAWGFMIWQGGMALGLGLVTIKKFQNALLTGLLILFFGLCGLAVFREGLTSAITMENSELNSYQQEVNSIVSPDFKLVDSKLVNEGIDVGLILTDDYTTRLSYPQAVAIIYSNASSKGYTLINATVGGSCLGGYEADSSRGVLDVCQTSYTNGVRTFEIKLNNFDPQPHENAPTPICLGDCPH